MINYYDGQIADLLPFSYTEKASVQALSLALREGTRLLYDYAARVYMYASIDSMPEYLLDYLAIELRTQYYSDDLDIEMKRSLVRNTLLWYTRAGTPAAVEELIMAVFGGDRVEEWWEFDGEPYWFRIYANAPMSEDEVEYLETMIKRVKNTRSWLSEIIFLRYIYTNLYAATLPQEFPIDNVRNEITIEDGEICQKEGAAALAEDIARITVGNAVNIEDGEISQMEGAAAYIESMKVVSISNVVDIEHDPTATGYAAAAAHTLTRVTIHNILSEEVDAVQAAAFGGILESIPAPPEVITS